MNLFQPFQSNLQIRPRRRKHWSYWNVTLKIFMTCSWLGRAKAMQMMKMQCSTKSICVVSPVQAVKKTWQTCTARKLSLCLGVKCPCATLLNVSLALVKALARCCRWFSLTSFLDLTPAKWTKCQWIKLTHIRTSTLPTTIWVAQTTLRWTVWLTMETLIRFAQQHPKPEK